VVNNIQIRNFSAITPIPKITPRDANLSKHFTGQIQPTQATTKNLSNKKSKKSEWARSPFD